jgi:hypothetical protein
MHEYHAMKKVMIQGNERLCCVENHHTLMIELRVWKKYFV